MRIVKFLLFMTLLLTGTLSVLLIIHQTGYHQILIEKTVLKVINENTKDLFSGTVKMDRFWLSRDLKIHGTNASGFLKTDQGPVEFKVSAFESTAPLYHYFLKDGLEIVFSGAKPAVTKGSGFEGTVVSGNKPRSFLHLKARLEGVDFSEVTWVNTDNLAGATGQLKGEIEYRIDGEKPFFKGNLEIAEPGGKIQARFFDLLTPYLPKAQVRKALKKVAANQGLVEYQKAHAEISLLTPTELKVLLHIMIPVYNLILNLNMTIRLDDENAFVKIAQIAGMIKVAA